MAEDEEAIKKREEALNKLFENIPAENRKKIVDMAMKAVGASIMDQGNLGSSTANSINALVEYRLNAPAADAPFPLPSRLLKYYKTRRIDDA